MAILAACLLLSAAASQGGEGPDGGKKFRGKVRWAFNAGETVTGRLVLTDRACLATVSGRFRGPIPGSGQGRVIALDKDTGRLLWEFKAQSGSPGPCVTWKDYAIFGSEDALYALDVGSGKLRWKVEIKGYLGRPAGITVAGDHVAVVASKGSLHLVQAETGKVIWKKDGQFDTVTADDRFLYVGSPGRTVPKEAPPTIKACTLKDGKDAWVFESQAGTLTGFLSFVLDSDHLYAATSSELGFGKHYLYALKKADGKVAWKLEQAKENRKGPYVLADKVYVTDWSGESKLVKAKTGEVLAYRYFSDDSFPIADFVTLELATAFDLKAGKRLWTANPMPKGKALQNSHMATPAVRGGRIYTDHHTGHVICIE